MNTRTRLGKVQAAVAVVSLLASFFVGFVLPVRAAPLGQTPGDVIINEVDADQVSTDSAEFVELYDGGVGNTDLTGLVLVFFNGSDDASYEAFDLDGQGTDANGYFVLCGDAGNVANCDLDVSPDTNLIQNGADAVALYVGDDTNF
ncbi:MAG: lamin tail domain-containing protein, partial [Chloroflexi bacterium]|nr:lamin tail domain-containing protein [Chloroflexota bacterium]